MKKFITHSIRGGLSMWAVGFVGIFLVGLIDKGSDAQWACVIGAGIGVVIAGIGFLTDLFRDLRDERAARKADIARSWPTP